MAIKVDVPPLQAGSYTVDVFHFSTTSQPDASFTLNVAAGEVRRNTRPAEGFWTDQAKPGTGFYLQQRGPLIGVGFFDRTNNGYPIWSVDASPMRADALVVAPPGMSQASCFGCLPYLRPSESQSAYALRFRFESARRAYVDFPGGRMEHVISLPYGARYVDLAMTDTVDAQFGSLPLPNLAGRWLFDVLTGARVVAIAEPLVGQDSAEFLAPAIGWGVRCEPAVGGGRAGCAILEDCCSPFVRSGFAHLGDVTEDRLRIEVWDPLLGRPTGQHYFAIRLPSAD